MYKRIILSQRKGPNKTYQKVVEFLKWPVCAELPVEWMKQVIKNSLPTKMLIPRELKNLRQGVLLPLNRSMEGELNVECIEKGTGCSHGSAMLPAGPVQHLWWCSRVFPSPWDQSSLQEIIRMAGRKGVLEKHCKQFLAGRRAEESTQLLLEKRAVTVSRRLRSTNHC